MTSSNHTRSLLFATGFTFMLVLALASFVTLTSPSSAQNTGLSQADATAQAQTIEAAVDALFTQTAEAESFIGLTQTVEAAFNAAQTGTAAFNATVQAQFDANLTATAQAMATPTPTPYPADRLRVVSSRSLDLIAGPLNTTAVLAPDGTRFAYLSRDRELCIYTVLGVRQRCASLADQPGLQRGRVDTESITWSPDGEWVAFTGDAFRLFIDPDIWVMNTRTGAVANLTDDGTDNMGFPGRDEPIGDVDISPRWLPDGRILFMRYNTVNDVTTAPNLFAISPEGGEPERIGVLRHGNIPYLLTYINPSQDGTQVTYSVDFRDTDNVGVWVSDITGRDARRLSLFSPELLSENRQLGALIQSALSPNGQHVLVIGAVLDIVVNSPEQSPVRVFSTTQPSPTGRLIDPQRVVMHAGWAPNGEVLAYLVRNVGAGADGNGLYLTSAPGQPGRLVLPGDFVPTTSLWSQTLKWGANNTLLLAERGSNNLVVVTLGE